MIDLHFAADTNGSTFVEFLGSAKLFYFCKFLQQWRFGRSRSSKVIDFGTNRKSVCDFL